MNRNASHQEGEGARRSLGMFLKGPLQAWHVLSHLTLNQPREAGSALPGVGMRRPAGSCAQESPGWPVAGRLCCWLDSLSYQQVGSYAGKSFSFIRNNVQSKTCCHLHELSVRCLENSRGDSGRSQNWHRRPDSTSMPLLGAHPQFPHRHCPRKTCCHV